MESNKKNSRNLEKLHKKCLKLRLIEIVDDGVFIDILKTLNFLKIVLSRFTQEFLEDALDFSKGINLVIEKSSDTLIVKYFPDLIESFLIILTSTKIADKLIDFLFIIQDIGIYVPDETKRFTFIEQEHLFKNFIKLIGDQASYKTQVLGMHFFVTYFSLFNEGERIKITDHLFPADGFENSKFCLLNLEKIDFDLNCRLFLNALNEENLVKNNRCNVFSLKAESIRIGDNNLIPPMEEDVVKLELWVDYNFSNETITFFCDSKSFKNSEYLWTSFDIPAANILDVQFKKSDEGTRNLTIYLKYPIFTDDKIVVRFVQIFKSVSFEFKLNQKFNYFCKKIWPVFYQRVMLHSQTHQTICREPKSSFKVTFLEKLIGSAFKENSPEPKETSALPKNEFKIPSVENIPKTSLKRRFLHKLDLNNIEPKAKRINLVKPIQFGKNEIPPVPSSTKKRKYTTKCLTTIKKSCELNILTINIKDCIQQSIKQPATVDVYDFNLELTPKKRAQLTVNPSNYLPHSDFNSPVKITPNKNASFSYRAAAKQTKSQNISQSEKLSEELMLNSSKDAQQFSKNEEMLEADSTVSVVDNNIAKTEGDENITIKESLNLKTPKITLKNKRFKKYSPL